MCTLPATLGRHGGSATVVLDDRDVSRRHARLDLTGDELVLSDLGSTNGTFVNDERITRRVLVPGDRLRIGRFELAWSFIDPDATELIDPGQLTALRPLAPGRVAARRVVEEAEAHNRRAGHELDGFLSFAHGFLPAEPPLAAFPDSHRAWDEMTGQLPALFRRLALRRAFDALPVLDARPEALPDRYLLRASTLLGVFAHAYQYMAVDPPGTLPDSLLRPWTTVSRRLGKQQPAVSYIDLFFYNWRLRDPAGARALDNMDLLVPTWDNPAERVFYLVTTEFAMGLTPVLGAMVAAQEAVVADDPAALEVALLVMLERLQYVTQRIYPQIDPNPRSRHPLDQVLWAKTVGTAGVPIFDGAPSPSGTAQPHIHAIDAFLERRAYGSLVGQQSVYLAGFFPRHWRDLVAALREVSVRQYVEETRNSALRGVYNAVLDAYAGDRGWMGLHRIKAYGFLEVAFKVGRQVTTGARFTGLFKDRTWDRVDGELAVVRDERRPPVGPPVVFGTARRGRVVTGASGAWTCYLDLDVTGQGVHHQPGDRVGVLAEHDDELVRRTVAALQATGEELVGLSPAWRAAVQQRSGYGDVDVLPLRTLLRFAQLRPIGRAVAKRLVRLSAVGSWRRIVDARMEDQWELWDVLNLLHAGGWDVTRLWKAAPDEADSLCAVIAPEPFRLYSIASAPPPGRPAATLRLIVAGLDYTSARTPWSYPRPRRGAASHFLRRASTEGSARLSLQIVATPRFRLPAEPDRPIVMFAAGSGIAPFHGFVAAHPGPAHLYWGVRSPEEFVEHADLDAAAAAGRLTLAVAFSRTDHAVAFDGRRHTVGDGTRRRVDDLIRAGADALWDLIGDRGAHVYICGSAPFAVAVVKALAGIVPGDGREFLRRLVAEGRLSEDVFTTYLGHAQQGARFDISELARHTTPQDGYWMAIGGAVFDVTEFIHLHIGGPHIIRNHVGLDATAAYRKVLHHVHAEIDAQLSMYQIGHLRRLRFGSRWGVVLTEAGLRSMPLEELFRTWVRVVYLLAGMENALCADYGFTAATATAGEDPAELSRFKAQYVVESHRRFLVSYLDGLLHDDLRTLWQHTVGFCDPALDVRTYDTDLAALDARADTALVRFSVGAVQESVQTGDDFAHAAALCRAYAHADVQLLRDVKHAVLSGVRAFEQHEADVIAQAGATLLDAARSALAAVAAYYQRLAAQTRAHGITAATPGDTPIPPDRGIPGHGGPLPLT
ncbi:FHA domain-containing protein [Dactylosporangium vinaceum]|uniref:FHA domain-containing protein n=1 Tax=Dactylosporangium vinaceum TaxID=53362 RepID=A0ABV5MS80_9ACTN|nr:FHA domain-containing protein [Dactylosporangium vinaceum]UAC00506.1 FHA domain-containing protein [Dactylosporangium vinaceum]